MKKRILAMTAAVLMAASLTACGSSPKETTAADTKAENAKTEETAAAEAGSEAAGGVLVMATNAEFPPYEYHDNGSIVGIDVDIAKAIAEKLGTELKLRMWLLIPLSLRLFLERQIWVWPV